MPNILSCLRSRAGGLWALMLLGLGQAGCAHPVGVEPSVGVHARVGGYGPVYGPVYGPAPVYGPVYAPPVVVRPAPVWVAPAPMYGPPRIVGPVVVNPKFAGPHWHGRPGGHLHGPGHRGGPGRGLQGR